MNVAVVILNWNGKSLLETFLPAVISHSPQANVYVADNASTDDSVAFIKSTFPTVSIIQNTQNGGYAKGYNDALKSLTEDIFILLNSDVEVTSNWLDPILECFNAEANTAIIQPKVLDYKRKDYFEYAGAAGGFIDTLGYPYCRGRIFNVLEKDEGQFDDTYPISRALYMYLPGEATGYTKDYIDWIYSEQAQSIVEELGFVPVN